TYVISSAGMVLNESNATVKDFKMTPKISRKQHAASLKYAQDYYDLKANTIQSNNYQWAFDKQEEFYIKFKELVLNAMDAKIYRDITVPHNTKENNLYCYWLRHVTFPCEVATLKGKNSKFSHEANSATSSDPGKLPVSNFNLTASNLYSGYKP